MLGCRAGCLHRRHVEDYRLARYQAELDRDRASYGYATEAASCPPLPTFRDWLVQTAGWTGRRDDAA